MPLQLCEICAGVVEATGLSLDAQARLLEEARFCYGGHVLELVEDETGRYVSRDPQVELAVSIATLKGAFDAVYDRLTRAAAAHGYRAGIRFVALKRSRSCDPSG